MNNLRQYLTLISVPCLLFVSLSGCEENTQPKDGTTPPISTDRLASIHSNRTISSAITHQCRTRGGVEIASGFDANQNQLLDPDEVSQTYIACHGLDSPQEPISLSQTPASAQQCPNGGTILHAGEQTIPLCHSSNQTNFAGYLKVKAMMQGFKQWLSDIEYLPQQLGAASQQFNHAIQLQKQGGQPLIESTALLLLALKKVHELDDGNYSIHELIDLSQDQAFTSVSGTLNKTGLSILSKDMKLMTIQNTGIEITFDNALFLTSQTNHLSLNISQLQLKSDAASLHPTDISASYAPNKPTDITTNPRNFDGIVSLTLGSASSPLHIETHSHEPLNFTGLFDANIVIYPSDIPDFYNQKNNYFNIKTLHFNGKLNHQGQTTGLKASINMPNADTYRHRTPPALLAQLATSDTFEIELSASSSSGEWKDNRRHGYFTRTSYQHFLLNHQFEKIKTTLKTIEEDWDNNGIANAISYETYTTDNDGYRSQTWQHFSLKEAQRWLKNSLTAGWTESNTNGDVVAYNWYWKSNTLNNEQYIDYYVETNYGKHGLQLPEMGTSQHYSAKIIKAYVDDYSPVHSFSNHIQYNIAIEIDLDTAHSSNEQRSLSLYADRYGYSPELGSLNIGLSYNGNNFTGHLPNPIINPFESWELFDKTIPSFSFTDNQGGLIYFNDINQPCYNHSENPCPQQSANIYYQGLHYGTVYRDKNGDWIVYYNDNTEALLYDAANM